MISTIFSSISVFFNTIEAMFIAIVISASSSLGFVQPANSNPILIVDVEPPIISVATSSPQVASTTVSVPKKTIPVPTPPLVPEVIPDPIPVVVSPCQTSSAVGTSTASTIGTTTLAIQNVPLLFGGTAHAGESVPVSYLQITNIGTACTVLKGFWIKQNGSASTTVVVGLSTVDDKGGSRGLTEGSLPFENGIALAPTDALFAPGQMRLFTIKAIMAHDVSPHVGTQLMISVISVETTATMRGQFPIQGTTWTIVK
ncbi:MAG: hypothetical protein Q8L30_01830 [bacterium]|nr:hypothetical protein [bacterium]